VSLWHKSSRLTDVILTFTYNIKGVIKCVIAHTILQWPTIISYVENKWPHASPRIKNWLFTSEDLIFHFFNIARAQHYYSTLLNKQNGTPGTRCDAFLHLTLSEEQRSGGKLKLIAASILSQRRTAYPIRQNIIFFIWQQIRRGMP
jgi:hypothetical protein